jgi:hypothetical protein
MDSLWSLPAMALAVPMYAVWRAKRSRMRKLPDDIPTVLHTPVKAATVPESAGRQSRVIQWISIAEFLSVLAKHSDLVVFDLRASAQWDPFPILTAFALPVNPNELDTLLEWLPADRSVVFYGASNLSIFMIETSHCMDGSAPLYVLEGDLSLAEVA